MEDTTVGGKATSEKESQLESHPSESATFSVYSPFSFRCSLLSFPIPLFPISLFFSFPFLVLLVYCCNDLADPEAEGGYQILYDIGYRQ
jgi:hypothetical protein